MCSSHQTWWREKIQADRVRDKGVSERQKGTGESEREQKAAEWRGRCWHLHVVVGAEKARQGAGGGPARFSVGGEGGPGCAERKLKEDE